MERIARRSYLIGNAMKATRKMDSLMVDNAIYNVRAKLLHRYRLPCKPIPVLLHGRTANESSEGLEFTSIGAGS